MEIITLKINHRDHSEVELINPKGEKFIFNPNVHEGFADFLHCAETIKSDNSHQLEKLEADKAELLEALEDCKERLENMNKRLIEVDGYSRLSVYFASKLNSIIQKMKQ